MQSKKGGRRVWLRQLLSRLPKFLRFPIFRQMVTVSYDEMPRLQMRIASTAGELEQAYRILHDSYVDQDYMLPDPSGLRIIKYFALPSTSTLIALWDGKVVGTMSIIRKTSFGLPIEKAFNIANLVENEAAIAEVSSLAIAKEFRTNRGLLFFPFCKFFYEYSEKYLRLSRIVIAVHPNMADFYEGILGFEVIQNKSVSKYKFANGNPAVGLWADFSMLRKKVEKWYGQKEILKNLNHYFTKHASPFIQYPERPFIKATDAVLTTDDFIQFFITKSNIYHKLPLKEKMALQSIYPGLSDFAANKEIKNVRRSGRFLTESWARTSDPSDSPIRVIDVSKIGLRMQVAPETFQSYKASAEALRLLSIEVKISEAQYSKLSGVIKWLDESNMIVGLQILKADENWDVYINYLSSERKVKSS